MKRNKYLGNIGGFQASIYSAGATLEASSFPVSLIACQLSQTRVYTRDRQGIYGISVKVAMLRWQCV